jgi:hypothetical protein
MQQLICSIAAQYPGANVLVVGSAGAAADRLEPLMVKHDLRLVGLSANAGQARLIASQTPTDLMIIMSASPTAELRALANDLEKTWGVASMLVDPGRLAA